MMNEIMPQALERLQEKFFRQNIDSESLSDAQLQQAIRRELAPELIGTGLSAEERRRLYEQTFHSLRGYGPIHPLMMDPSILEIMVNGPDAIFCEVDGVIRRSPVRFASEDQLENFIQQLFGARNRQLSRQYPMAELQLPDGSRAHAVIRPAAADGPVLTIRKFTGIRPTTEALLERGFMTEECLELLKEAVINREAIFLAGGTGTGKTTFLNALSAFIPPQERVITIEDACELQLQGLPNCVRLEAQRPGPDGKGGVSISELIRSALRMRPDRIIVGEVRGAEAVDLMHAMNTGHPGTLCTGHGNSPRGMLRRLAQLIYTYADLPYDTVLESLCEGFDWLCYLERDSSGHRALKQLVRCHGYRDGEPQLEEVYTA